MGRSATSCNADDEEEDEDEEEEDDDDEDDDEEDTNCGCMRFFLSFPRDFSCSILRFRTLAPVDGNAGEELPSGREANDMWGVMRESESPASSRALASWFASSVVLLHVWRLASGLTGAREKTPLERLETKKVRSEPY